MTDPDKVKLLFGPYERPRLRLGGRVHCLYRDKLVLVHGYTDAPLPWTLCRQVEGRGRPGARVEEKLARAECHESALALRHWRRVPFLHRLRRPGPVPSGRPREGCPDDSS